MMNLQILKPFLPLGLLLLSLLQPAIASADLPGQTLPTADEQAPAADPTSAIEIARRTDELVAERAQLALQLQEQPADAAANVFLSGLDERLSQIELLLQTQHDLAELLALKPQATTAEHEDEPSVYQLNALYEQLASVEAALLDKRDGLKAAKERLQNVKSRAKEAKAALAEASPKSRQRRERALQTAELVVREVQEQVIVATLELRAAKRDKANEEILQGRMVALRNRLAAGEGSADNSLALLVGREGSLERTRAAAERRLATTDLRLAAAKKQYAQDPDSAGLLPAVEALTSYRDAIGKRISLATAEQERLASLRDVWRGWDSLLRQSYSEEELASWGELVTKQLNDLGLATTLRQGQVADMQIGLQNLEARSQQLEPGSQARVILEETVEVMHQLQTDLSVANRLLASDTRLTQRFGEELAERTGNVGLLEVLSQLRKTTATLWNFEITTIDEEPFTIGSLLTGILLFAAGFWVSRFCASLIGRVAAKRLKLDAGATHAMQTFSFYALLAAFTLLALRAVHFPLAAFTFLGGALAIGVGFGSQNVMNNFISGLILMLERPVRAQDVVEIDGAHGVIQRIGPRSTQIRSTDGRHIVVPNSFFLESNVVNWTLSDDLMRSKVSVGVAYGSPTRLVKQLIEEIIDAEPLALTTPPPNVIFDAFADNTLNFDVYFWVEARSPMSVRDVQSRVRFRIDDVFREHNISIALPQRDVHLDSTSPIEVRMVGTTNIDSEGHSRT